MQAADTDMRGDGGTWRWLAATHRQGRVVVVFDQRRTTVKAKYVSSTDTDEKMWYLGVFTTTISIEHLAFPFLN